MTAGAARIERRGGLVIMMAFGISVPACGGSPGPRDPALASQAPTREEEPRESESDASAGSAGADDGAAAGTPSSAGGNGEHADVAVTAVDAPPPPDDHPVLETLTGRASYYADRFHGRPTASGEPYDMHALTAASRDLPFGTIVRVVRVDTGASVIVRVNDRGPFRDHARILDLSRAAAEALDMIRAGVVEIRAEILQRGDGRRWRADE